MLFQLQHVCWGPWKGRIKERRKRGKRQLGDRGGMMEQGKHSLGHLLIEGHTVCSKTMLILLLCHPQVYPLCSNAPTLRWHTSKSTPPAPRPRLCSRSVENLGRLYIIEVAQ